MDQQTIPDAAWLAVVRQCAESSPDRIQLPVQSDDDDECASYVLVCNEFLRMICACVCAFSRGKRWFLRDGKGIYGCLEA